MANSLQVNMEITLPIHIRQLSVGRYIAITNMCMVDPAMSNIGFVKFFAKGNLTVLYDIPIGSLVGK